MNATINAYLEARKNAPASFSEYDAGLVEFYKQTPAEACAIAERMDAHRKEVTKRLAVERRVIRHFIRTAKAAGFEVHNVYDGEERVKVRNETEALAAVFSVDDSTIYFSKADEPGRKRECLVIVLGNGAECLADMSCGRDDWDAVVDAACDYADEQSE